MLKIFAFIISIFLIFVICLRVPQESMGLTNFAGKSEMFGSPSSTQRFINIITSIGILIYLGLALQLNLVKTIH